MADINPVNESAKAFQVANIKNQDNAKTDDAFDKLFSKALDKTEASEMESSSTGLLQEIAAPENLKFISSSDIVSRKTGGFDSPFDPSVFSHVHLILEGQF